MIRGSPFMEPYVARRGVTANPTDASAPSGSGCAVRPSLAFAVLFDQHGEPSRARGLGRCSFFVQQRFQIGAAAPAVGAGAADAGDRFEVMRATRNGAASDAARNTFA